MAPAPWRAPCAAPSKKLRGAITQKGALKHLRALQEVADASGGNRASGVEGYGGSVQYVLTQLRAAGYKPKTQGFDFVTFEEVSDPILRQVSPTPKELHPGRVRDHELLGERRHRREADHARRHQARR